MGLACWQRGRLESVRRSSEESRRNHREEGGGIMAKAKGTTLVGAVKFIRSRKDEARAILLAEV